MKRTLISSLLLTILLLSTAAQAAIKPHGLFGDNAVLQQGDKVPVWGTTDAAGPTQPAEPEWNLKGYANNAVERIPVTVR